MAVEVPSYLAIAHEANRLPAAYPAKMRTRSQARNPAMC